MVNKMETETIDITEKKQIEKQMRRGTIFLIVSFMTVAAVCILLPFIIWFGMYQSQKKSCDVRIDGECMCFKNRENGLHYVYPCNKNATYLDVAKEHYMLLSIAVYGMVFCLWPLMMIISYSIKKNIIIFILATTSFILGVVTFPVGVYAGFFHLILMVASIGEIISAKKH